MKGIKDIFDKTFNCDFHIKDTSVKNLYSKLNYNIFLEILNLLDESNITEDELYEDYGIDISRLVTPLWVVIGMAFNELFGEDERKMIFKYLINSNKILKGERLYYNKNGEKIDISTPLDLWDNVNPNKDEIL